jgi:hypothetical protein
MQGTVENCNCQSETEPQNVEGFIIQEFGNMLQELGLSDEGENHPDQNR